MWEVLAMIFETIWQLVNIEIDFDGIAFRLWHFPLFCVMLGVFIRLIFSAYENKKKGGS